MITSPTEQFRRIKERPMIWGAMGIIVVLFIIGSWLNMREVDLFSGMEVDEELVGLSDTFKVYGAIIGGVLGPLLGVLTVSAVFFLISKIVEVTVSFRQLFSMNTYISLITVFGLIINGGLSMLRLEEHTSELQSRGHLVCRLLLEKKKYKKIKRYSTVA